MPNTPDHKVEMYLLAEQRRAAGKPSWDRKINLADIFHNEDIPAPERRALIAERLQASSWLKGRDELDDLVILVGDLGRAGDTAEFDDLWDQVYDFADEERVWITTR